MATFKVTAPEAGHSGKVGKVQFRDGVAEIDSDSNPAELAYCRNAGYLIEEGERATPEDGGSQEPAKTRDEGDDPFDPSAHSVEDVLDYLESVDADEATRVLDAEAGGKARKGITNQRDAILDSKKEEK